jgi:CelD/BcsL family acetyltransferase involved in cellulose biosynthesis
LGVGLPQHSGFQEELTRRAAAGDVRGYLLLHQGRAVAYLYCRVKQGIWFYDYAGYDPEFAGWSPGSVLQYCVLERLFSEPDARFFDFTEGEGPHKEFFATASTRCAEVWYLKPSLRNLFLVTGQSSLHWATRGTARALDAIRLKRVFKRILRKMG